MQIYIVDRRLVAEGSIEVRQFGRAPDLTGLGNVPEMFRQCSGHVRPKQSKRCKRRNVHLYTEYRRSSWCMGSTGPAVLAIMCWSGLFARVTNAAPINTVHQLIAFRTLGISNSSNSEFQVTNSAFLLTITQPIRINFLSAPEFHITLWSEVCH